jgi:hypothetical protein
MHHVLIRDDELAQYRRITEEDKDRLVVCPDGDLYRVVDDAAPMVCLLNDDGERLCDFSVPHDHYLPVMAGDADDRRITPRRDVARGIE